MTICQRHEPRFEPTFHSAKALVHSTPSVLFFFFFKSSKLQPIAGLADQLLGFTASLFINEIKEKRRD